MGIGWTRWASTPKKERRRKEKEEELVPAPCFFFLYFFSCFFLFFISNGNICRPVWGGRFRSLYLIPFSSLFSLLFLFCLYSSSDFFFFSYFCSSFSSYLSRSYILTFIFYSVYFYSSFIHYFLFRYSYIPFLTVILQPILILRILFLLFTSF